MQGYKRKTYRLRWPEESDLHGLEINLRGLSIGDLEKVSNLRLQGAGNNMDQILPVLGIFAKALISWNLLGEDDQPVSITLESIQEQDARMLIAAVLAWVEVVSDIPVPLRKPSPDGEPFPEESIPMETLSPSLLNSNTPN